ncbi:hypothetical protein Mal64_01340 [Pseudobythopirellula maris]|uniref:Uncharacterized protein n=1 Tax=Pseudobythopirellula maris TaxID=2527991 RepID=A0A5C5ZRP1_9BACT|nr:hypothetical protein [Pseudobythopirellula maris]TWT89755.1 hypothetical protein Mal64_01340 [Pseudobythopirellula maris]
MRTFLCCALLVASGSIPGNAQAGKVVLLGDDWLLSDYAFDASPTATETLADSLAEYAIGPGAGEVLIASDLLPMIPFGKRGVTSDAFVARLQSLGHTLTVDAAASMTLENLAQYDAVLLAGSVGSGSANSTALEHYVLTGGSVVIAAGTEDFSSYADEAAAWAPLLEAFGLELGATGLGPAFGTIAEVPASTTAGLPGDGSSHLSWSSGQVATAASTTNPRTTVAVRGDFSGLGGGPQGALNDVIALYEAPYLPGDFNDNGVVDAADFTVWRDALGESVTLPGDPTPGTVTEADYDVWVVNFGETAGVAAAALGVPEPGAVALAFIVYAVFGASSWRRPVQS